MTGDLRIQDKKFRTADDALVGGEGVEDRWWVVGAVEDGVDAGEGFGDGGLHGEGERKGEGERLRADGQEEGAFGDALIEIVAEAQKE